MALLELSFLIGEIIQAVGLTLAKLGVLAFYLRIFGTTRQFKYSIWSVAALCIFWGVGIIVDTAVTCAPSRNAARIGDPDKLYDENIGLLVLTVVDVLLDLIILCLPFPKLWGLSLTTKRKTELSIVFVLDYW